MSSPTARVFTATSSNPARTITVTCTDQGAITQLHFDAAVYGRGARYLAAEILRLAQRSTVLAKGQRREVLAAAGWAPALLNRLGLPTPEAVEAQVSALDAPAADTEPHRWVRAV